MHSTVKVVFFAKMSMLTVEVVNIMPTASNANAAKRKVRTVSVAL